MFILNAAFPAKIGLEPSLYIIELINRFSFLIIAFEFTTNAFGTTKLGQVFVTRLTVTPGLCFDILSQSGGTSDNTRKSVASRVFNS